MAGMAWGETGGGGGELVLLRVKTESRQSRHRHMAELRYKQYDMLVMVKTAR